MEPLRIFLITGLSGAGKSNAVQAFEDMGFFCVDNLPLELVDSFLEHCRNHKRDKKGVALVLDVREDGFMERFPEVVASLDRPDVERKVLFLEASSSALLNRYKESRRPHPLGENRTLEEALEAERERLAPIRERADMVIDTTDITTHQFKGLLTSLNQPETLQQFTFSLVSFGFKHGIPGHLDVMFDARFLPNPHYQPGLREKTGRDPEVAEYLEENVLTSHYLHKLQDVLEMMMESYYTEGKMFLSVGVGCTGGRHRSVFLVEELARHFNAREQSRAVVTHRDLERDEGEGDG